MLKRLSQREQIAILTAEFSAKLRYAFLEAVADIVSRAELARIIERLERSDIEGAIAAVHLDGAAFRNLDDAIAQAFNAGGAAVVGSLPILRDPSGGRFVVRWDARNLRAESWLRSHSSSLITRITADQMQSIRTALSLGLAEGRNPRRVALDVVGRINRVTGRRDGGLLGLTPQQERFVAGARAELSSGDATAMRAYLARTRRDKRFDRAVLDAITAGKAVPAETLARITGRYADRLLQLRGETIGRTETSAALNQSGIEAMRQAADAGAVDAGTITKVWHTARDPRVRDSHATLDGETVGLDGLFGNGLAYPGDPSGGPEETANCRCWLETRIDFLAGIR